MPRARMQPDRRRDHAYLLVAQMAAFAGVRVKTADRDARRGNAPALREIAVQDLEDLTYESMRDRGAHVLQRQMRRGERDAHAAGGQHHDRPRRCVRCARYSVWPVKAVPASLIRPL